MAGEERSKPPKGPQENPEEKHLRREDFQGDGLFILHAMLSSGSISSRPDGVYFNFAKVDELLLLLRDDQPQEFPTIEEKRIKSRLIENYQLSFDGMVNEGVVSASLADASSKIATGKDVELSVLPFDNILGRFNYQGSLMPQSDQERRENLYLAVNPNGVSKHVALSSSTVECVNLTQDQMLDIILSEILTHEIGHLLTRTAAILQATNTVRHMQRTQYNYPSTIETERGIHSLLLYAADQMTPSFEINQALGNDGTKLDYAAIASERIACGFQNLGRKLALIRNGASLQDAQANVARQNTLRQRAFKDKERVIREAKEHGFRIKEIQTMATQFGKYLKHKGGKYTRLGHLMEGEALNFSISAFGYHFPFTEDELKTFFRFAQAENLYMVPSAI